MTLKQKQWQLRYLGYYSGSIDGIWGRHSTEAARSFQQENGLDTDSGFEAASEAKSIEIIKEIQKIVAVCSPTALVIDGLAGEKTMAATACYQKEAGLTADGIAGPKTRAMLAQSAEAPSGSWWDHIRYFSRAEFACKCGGRYCSGFPAEPQQLLVQTANELRAHFGAAVTVSSGLRCKQHNANCGGVAASRHLSGKAMDFRVAGKTASEVLEYVKQQPQIRYAYAINANYVHMDIC